MKQITPAICQAATRLLARSGALAVVAVLSIAVAPIDLSPQEPSRHHQIAWVLQQLNYASDQSNLCNGGLENGKRIVSEAYLENPMQETTRLGCEVDGGSPIQVPDLPAPDDRATRLA